MLYAWKSIYKFGGFILNNSHRKCASGHNISLSFWKSQKKFIPLLLHPLLPSWNPSGFRIGIITTSALFVKYQSELTRCSIIA